MKKLLVLVLGLAVVLSISAFAQDNAGMGKSDKAAAAPLKSLKGTIKAEGDKLTFVTDKDKKSWDIANLVMGIARGYHNIGTLRKYLMAHDNH